MARKHDGRTIIFTIVSSNYLSYAATLMQSVRAVHPDAQRVIVLADTSREFPGIDLAAELIPVERFEIEDWESMAAYYAIIEFNTAIKPFVIQRLFDWHAASEVIYLDPDIRVFEPLTEVQQALRDHSIVLTPHMMHPLQDGKQPCDHTIMKSGVYNFGFFACRADADAKRLVAWWADRCRAHCRVDIAGNMFTDQRWMDLAPVFVERPMILRHPGYNVAYWNLAHRTVTKADDGTWRVDDKPLVFFHFSGISIDNTQVFSKYQNRFTGDALGTVGELCADYRAAVRANGWQETATIPYGFGEFQDGSRIEPPMRRWLLNAKTAGTLKNGLPAGLTAAFFDEPEDDLETSGAVVTRFMAQVWRDRDDLRSAFNLATPGGRQQYLAWFLNDAADQGIARRCVTGAAAVNGRKSAPAPVEFAKPPWPSVAELRGLGDLSRPLRDILACDVRLEVGGTAMLIPAMAALAWENRIDLQQAFPLRSTAETRDFLGWALTDGVLQGHIRPELLTEEFARAWDREAVLSQHYGDVPLTAGMLATASRGIGSPIRSGTGHFPMDRSARLSHGLWFAYWAVEKFAWPERAVKKLREFFAARSAVKCGSFSLTRGTLAIWELRPDVQAAFPFMEGSDTAGFLFWLATHLNREFGIDIDSLDPRMREFLMAPDEQMPELTRFARLAHASRGDLREAFDLKTREGRLALSRWSVTDALTDYAETSLPMWIRSGENPTADTPLRVGGVLVGYWTAASGRGEDLRCTHAALQSLGYQDYLILDLGSRSLLTPDGTPVSAGTAVRADFAIVHTNADTASTDTAVITGLGVAADRLIGYWAWELETLPARWRHAFTCYDEIWAATKFAYGSFERERLRPVSLVPLAVQPIATPEPIVRYCRGWRDDETVFLFVFDLRSFMARKNPAAVISSFKAAFPDTGTRVRLVIKTMGGNDRPSDLQMLRASLGDPRIDLIDGELPRDGILSLVADCDCFVSLHRSEGFGRGPAEAMLLGKPVILTDYSGTRDFADADTALPIRYGLVPVGRGEYPGGDGQYWADADVAMAAARMRWVHDHRKEAVTLGKRGQQRIQERLSPAAVGEIIARTLGLVIAATAGHSAA